MPPKSNLPKASQKKAKTRVNFGANSTPRKRKASPAGDTEAEPSASSSKRPRTDTSTSGSRTAGDSISTGTGAGPSSTTSGAGATNNDGSSGSAVADTPAKRARNRWGISPADVPAEAKMTQRAFQRFIRGLCGLLTQADVLPSAINAQKHYDRRFKDADDYRLQMRALVDESRTAVSEAKALATKLVRDAKRVAGPIANDIARIPELHLATVFTMILKTGLKGFCPDLEGPVQSTYNQIHRHLAVSGFQFLAASFALAALDVNMKVAENTELLGDMYDNYTYGTLAQKTKMERRRPGSLGQSLKHGVEYKARGRLCKVRSEMATRLELRKPVQRMTYVQEAHSDDEDGNVREKPGRNPVVGEFFVNELDPEAEHYRKRNAKGGQKEPKKRIRSNPLRPASDIGMILPPDVPIDFFTPEFYNALTLEERARYAYTGVAFPLAEFVFADAHKEWRTMGRKDFMAKYGDDVLKQYNVPSPEEIDAIPDTDVEDEEEIELNLQDTDDDEMDIDEDGAQDVDDDTEV
ncbi:hypothetical protein C8J57DRAFT_1520532 [Mycena rebaudengoi]|nr:hypothetical protein C8J57DRAFT_1520532 [Mycena rebaudengoi]